MDSIDNELPLPEQHQGGEKNIESTVNAGSIHAAEQLYNTAKQRLLDVNNWDKICGELSAVFRLTDDKGKEIAGDITQGSCIKIDVPGPGTASGKGYDWVRIENIEEKKDSEEDAAFILITVRPADNPQTKDNNIAHFFSDKATSNFVVKREGTKVTAAVYGRNEVPNTGTDNIIDKARNAVVGVSAIAGVSNAQWKSLTNGLVNESS